MQKFKLEAYNIFLLIIVGGIAFGLFLEPVKVLTLLIWVFLVAGVFLGVESLVKKKP
jgi:hypothetical protein